MGQNIDIFVTCEWPKILTIISFISAELKTTARVKYGPFVFFWPKSTGPTNWHMRWILQELD
jgi:hypothetical protein